MFLLFYYRYCLLECRMHACMIYMNRNLYIPMIYAELVSFSYVFIFTIGHNLHMNVFIVIVIVSMESSSRAPKHAWTKDEEATLVSVWWSWYSQMDGS